MRQQNHVLALSPTGGAILPGEIAALADAENFAEPVNGEFLLRLIDEAEPHRLPSLAKSCGPFQDLAFLTQNFILAAQSFQFGGGIFLARRHGRRIDRRSRLRPIQRTKVDSPIPRSSAISRCVRPLVCASRTASSANSGVNLCLVIEFTFHLRKTLHSFEASPRQRLQWSAPEMAAR